MSTRVTAAFQITGWDETAYDEPADGPKRSRATVTKTFTGEVVGESTAELLMCQATDGSAGYLAQERFEGSVDGRAGSFVIHHGGIRRDDSARPFGHVVPGSGTGELRGITGTASYRHDESGATFILEFDLE